MVLLQNAAPLGVPLAYALKEICDATWASDPPRAVGAAAALADLAAAAPDPEIDAVAAWAAGIAAITEGAMEASVAALATAYDRFTALGKPTTAAATQVGRLIALAMLGRYDEAVICGTQARDTFLAHGDDLSAGKIEQNLGGMAWRRDRYREAEQFHRAARERFAAAGHTELLVAAENALAADLAQQFRLREAADRYANALALAEGAGLDLRQAEIESNLGNLALAQGRYDQALDFLERSRRRYATLGMPHESAYAEQELADAYLDLNMAAEAAVIYARATPTFERLGLRADQAWAMAHHGRAAALLDNLDLAGSLFEAARRLFDEEGNAVNAALLTLYEAQLAYRRGAYAEALDYAERAEPVFADAGSDGRALLTHWLRGECLRCLGRPAEAYPLLRLALQMAEERRLPQIAQRCLTSKGLLAAAEGDPLRAERNLRRAIAVIEELRAPLPTEELRAAFGGDKVGPYTALIRLCLEAHPPRLAEALDYAERSRARALAELLSRSAQTFVQPRDTFEAQLVEQLAELREELNWLYTQTAHEIAAVGGGSPALERLQAATREREASVLEISRQLQLRGNTPPDLPEPFDLAALQGDLGTESALVVYYGLDAEILAFVVTDTAVTAVRRLADAAQIDDLVSRLRFQIEAIRRFAHGTPQHHHQLLRRARHHLAQLYDLLLRPLEAAIGERRLVIVPHRGLHYLPFHALFDGARYVVERREVCTVPSAGVLRHCLGLPQRPHHNALLLGLPDSRAPHVLDEVMALRPLFAEHVALLGEAASADGLRRHAPAADLIHLACHGTFRPDNPLFSALHLADGRFTARDAYTLALRCNLVVLSACETGVSSVAPGDEPIGLARGFFAAGAPTLLVSLWTVDDRSTATLMTIFYERLQRGEAPAAALRAAQVRLLADHPHPFFWAPFVLMGRW